MLLAQERGVAHHWLTGRPAQPVLWLALLASDAPEQPPSVPAARRLQLWTDGTGFTGDVRCGLPLPLPSESFGSVVVQHLCEGDPGALIEESVRVLAPGGRLLMFTLNPLSPYRFRWSGHAIGAREVGHWQERLRQLGLHLPPASEQYLGPVWRTSPHGGPGLSSNRLRAVCVLDAEKRAVAIIPPTSVRRAWNAGAAPA